MQNHLISVNKSGNGRVIDANNRTTSIEESEEPKWDFVANAHLDIVVCDKAVGRILYLPKRLALAALQAHEAVPPVDLREEIALEHVRDGQAQDLRRRVDGQADERLLHRLVRKDSRIRQSKRYLKRRHEVRHREPAVRPVGGSTIPFSSYRDHTRSYRQQLNVQTGTIKH